MALTTEEIAGHPALHWAIRRQSQAMVESFSANPRLGSVFATQQRWLMGHAGAALYFRRHQPGHGGAFSTARFLEVIRQHNVASRNTGHAFIQEMLNYKFVRYAPGGEDKRVRPMEPSPQAVETLSGWAMVHLSSLDSLDGGSRLGTYLANADALARLQPLICDRLLVSPAVREPQRTFSLFTWLNHGGNVMDWLISGIDPAADGDRVPTAVLSIADMAAWLKLSRTHLARKLREAEAMGSVGWQGRRGHSVMWVSKGFRAEYAMAQAVKLAIIDDAFDACFWPPSA
jgi:hypothetical protein